MKSRIDFIMVVVVFVTVMKVTVVVAEHKATLRIVEHIDFTQLVIDLSYAVSYHQYVEEDGHKVVVSLAAPLKLTISDSLPSSIVNIEQAIKGDITELHLSTPESVMVKSMLLRPESDVGYLLIFDLIPIDNDRPLMPLSASGDKSTKLVSSYTLPVAATTPLGESINFSSNKPLNQYNSFDHASLSDSFTEFSVPGFRLALFGKTIDEVRKAISDDFGTVESSLAEDIASDRKGKTLSIHVSDLLVGAGEAKIVYIFFGNTPTLARVKVIWGSSPDKALSEKEAQALINRLVDYYEGLKYLSGGAVYNFTEPNGKIIPFCGIDSNKRMVLLQTVAKIGGNGKQVVMDYIDKPILP